MIRIELAEAAVLAPATRSLRQTFVIGIVLLIVATAAGCEYGGEEGRGEGEQCLHGFNCRMPLHPKAGSLWA